MSYRHDKSTRPRDRAGMDRKTEVQGGRAQEEELGEHDEITAGVLSQFRGYQQELDERYDRHERLVKKSRDLTIESKRIIFLLHRISNEGNREEILEQAKNRLEQLKANVLCAIALELQHEDPYLFLKAYTFGCQEFIEALCCYHYEKHKSLISYGEVQQTYFSIQKRQDKMEDKGSDDTIKLHLPFSEYILGVADLTGEVMRKCINSIGSGDATVSFNTRVFLRGILEGFSFIGNSGPREVTGKLHVLRQSVDKVENACYAIEVRRKEFPDCKLPDVLFLSHGGGGGGGVSVEYGDDETTMAEF